MKKVIIGYCIFVSIVSMLFGAYYFFEVRNFEVYEREELPEKYTNCLDERGIDICTYEENSYKEILPDECNIWAKGNGEVCSAEHGCGYRKNISESYERPMCMDKVAPFENFVFIFYFYSFIGFVGLFLWFIWEKVFEDV